MGLKDDLGSITASIQAEGTLPSKDPSPRQARTAPGQLFAFSEQSKAMERELEALKKAAGAPRMIKRSQLRKSPYQTRTITAEAVAELAHNLRDNPLVSPIVVRELAENVFETIAGHKRDAAYGVLDRDEIPAIVVVMTDEQAERAVFYDNFFPPDICDYEKFLGLQQIRQRHAYTHEKLAEKSGISRQLIGYLMAFERLPESALQLLSKHPTLIGANTAAKLAQVDVKKASRVLEGLQMLVEGKIKQALLFDWVNQKSVAKKLEPTVFKAGRVVYAKVLRRDSRLTIDFSNVSDAESLERDIAALIKERAGAKK